VITMNGVEILLTLGYVAHHAGNSADCLGRRRYGRLMFTTHALLVSAMTPARGPLQSIRLRAGRLALACATA
jgi:hypothetical protein